MSSFPGLLCPSALSPQGTLSACLLNRSSARCQFCWALSLLSENCKLSLCDCCAKAACKQHITYQLCYSFCRAPGHPLSTPAVPAIPPHFCDGSCVKVFLLCMPSTSLLCCPRCGCWCGCASLELLIPPSFGVTSTNSYTWPFSGFSMISNTSRTFMSLLPSGSALAAREKLVQPLS